MLSGAELAWLAGLRVALAVALGACGLAVGAHIHSLFPDRPTSTGNPCLLLLGIWLVFTALPTFLQRSA
jgi:hypothetical protein